MCPERHQVAQGMVWLEGSGNLHDLCLHQIKSGLHAFICDRLFQATDAEVIAMVAKNFDRQKFWYGIQTHEGIRGSKRVVIFEKPQAAYNFWLDLRGKELRFRAVNREKCSMCVVTVTKSPHVDTHGTGPSPAGARCADPHD